MQLAFAGHTSAIAARRAPYPVHLIETARLRDGRPYTIRPIRRADLRLERAFATGLSAQTRYQRLLSGRKLLPGELKRLTDIDYANELALVAVAHGPDGDRFLAVARYVRDDAHEPGSCEFAIVVADESQGQGLGEALLRRLVRAASEEGIAVMTGLTLSDNVRMIALARKLGFRARRDPGYASLTEVRLVLQDARADALDATPAFDDALLWSGA